MAFRGAARAPGVDGERADGYWLLGLDSLRLIALEGAPAPGAPLGFAFTEFFQTPSLNDQGETVFLATIADPAVAASDEEGFWIDESGGLRLIVRTGTQAPDTRTGTFFADLFVNPTLNNLSQTVFRAQLAGPDVDSSNDIGLWLEDASGVSLIAREGDPVPSAPAGTFFVNFAFNNNIQPAIDDLGQIAFYAEMDGPGVDDSNSAAIWLRDPAGQLKMLLRSGDEFDVDDGPGVDLRTIERIAFRNSYPVDKSLNNKMQLAFGATFTDGTSGIFVMNLTTIPEPSSSVIFLTSSLFLNWYPRRRAIVFKK